MKKVIINMSVESFVFTNKKPKKKELEKITKHVSNILINALSESMQESSPLEKELEKRQLELNEDLAAYRKLKEKFEGLV